MSGERHTVELAGCAPVPLAHYLKALGVLRLVSEQVDAGAQGWWKNDTFWLRSTLDRIGLVEFFLERYKPTPLVGPWGARSGFFPGASPKSDSEKSAREALNRIASAADIRFQSFRDVIQAVRTSLRQLGMTTKPKDDNEKLRLMVACRSLLPDELIPWFDAAFVLLNAGRSFPPLLGTGGNEGSGSYMSGFAQQVVAVLVNRNWDHAAHSALFGTLRHDVHSSQTPGQFSPESLGGTNASQEFETDPATNPWDYLLLLEGTLFFGAACAKKLGPASESAVAFPFCVRPVGIGYASRAASDEIKSKKAKRKPLEMWFPLWTRPATRDELLAIFCEGRVQVRKRDARNGVDFARAVAAFGIDRGIRAFQRYGFLERNPPLFCAVPLGRFDVRGNPKVEELLAPIDSWLGRFRAAATTENAPARAGRALRHLEAAILELCRQGKRRQVQDVLIALGEAEAAMAASPKLRDPKTGLSPIPLLSAEWLTHANDGSPEFRLAAALASIHHEEVGPLRRHLEPIDPKSWWSQWPKWSSSPRDPNIVWGGGGLVRNLLAVLNRRTIDAFRHGKQHGEEELLFPGHGRCTAAPGDIAAFIDGDVDDERIEALLHGLILIKWWDVRGHVLEQLRGPKDPIPDAAYALLKLCHLPHKIDGHAVPLVPAITHRAAAGDGTEATRLAARRLRGSGLPPAVDVVNCRGDRARRTAAALMFPVWHSEITAKITDVRRLMNLVLPPAEPSKPDEETQEAADRRPTAV